MENNDTTLREMQQQMQQLRDKLENEKIVNERLLQKSCRQTADRLKYKSYLPIIFAIAAILLMPSLLKFGVSMAFIIFTWGMMLVCIMATILTNRNIPGLDKDLVTATQELSRYKKIHAEWIKVAIPMLVVWVGFLTWDLLRNATVSPAERYCFITGVGVGIILGGILGFKLRRDQIKAADELLEQIEELRGE